MKRRNVWGKGMVLLSFFCCLGLSAQIQLRNFDQFKSWLHKNNDTTYILNFWATWCSPCVKEIPYFLQVQKKYSQEALQVILISLDAPNQLNNRLLPFVVKHKITVPVILLDQGNPNKWIPEVHDSWTGSIPATLIYKNKKRAFYEQSFTYEELESVVHQFIEP